MIPVLLDTNVILDALLDREPWATDAKKIWAAHLEGQLAAHVTATSLTDVFYVSYRIAGRSRAWQAVRACLDQLYVIPVGLSELLAAASWENGDFEDNLQMALASSAQVNAIVTRDTAGFSTSAVRVQTPAQLVARLSPTAPETTE